MSAADTPDLPVGDGEARELFANLQSEATIAIAVSGGRDSMALLRLAHRWSRESGGRPRLAVLTVDHGLRPEAPREVDQVARWCAALGIEHYGLRWDGRKPASRLQERARESRYSLMTGWCRANGAGALVVAHRLEDQAETVLMRLARASGVDGLAAMRGESMWNGVRIVRPLLGIARARLEATLARFGQGWIDDPSNDDPSFERVRLRALRPALESAGLTAAMVSASAAKLARAAEALDILATETFEATVSVEPGGYGWIDRGALALRPREIVIRVLARALRVVGGPARIADATLERAAGWLIDGDGRGLTLGRCRLAETGGRVLVVRERRELPRGRLSPGEEGVWDERFSVALDKGALSVELRALGRVGFPAACALEPRLGDLPRAAGMVLPGGFRDGALALAPTLHDGVVSGALSVRFLRPSGYPQAQ